MVRSVIVSFRPGSPLHLWEVGRSAGRVRIHAGRRHQVGGSRRAGYAAGVWS